MTPRHAQISALNRAEASRFWTLAGYVLVQKFILDNF